MTGNETGTMALEPAIEAHRVLEPKRGNAGENSEWSKVMARFFQTLEPDGQSWFFNIQDDGSALELS